VVGVSTYEFTSGDWLLTLAALSLSPTQLLYELGLDNGQAGFHWTGRLDASNVLLESNLGVAVDVQVVREIVLAYVRQNYAAEAPPENLVWIGERTTPAGIADHEWCQFVSGDWTMAVDYDVGRPDQVVYEVDLRNSSTGFVWRGQVDAEGTVLEHR